LALLPQKELFRWVCFFFAMTATPEPSPLYASTTAAWFKFKFSLAFVFSS
jgi:hypothetical protein